MHAADWVICNGSEFPTTELGSEHEQIAIAEHFECQKVERKRLRQLVKAAADQKVFRVWARGYLQSAACAFVAMVEQAKRLPRWKRLPLSAYHALSKSLMTFQPIMEPVEFWYEPKTSGSGHRLLHDFGPLHRAAQHMVTRVLSAKFKPRVFQYGIERRGQADAIELIKTKIASGYHHSLTLDVKDFFNSFSRETLTKLLPLPRSVLTNVVVPNKLELKPKKGTKHSTQAYASTSTHPIPSQTVLPQGSACSNIVAAYVVSLLDIVLPAGVILIMYVDDICLLAKNADDLKHAESALLLAFEESTAGDFTFDISEGTLDGGGLRYLGYDLHLLPDTKNLLVRPTTEATNHHKKECKLREGRIAHSANTNTDKVAIAVAIADYYLYRLAWVTAFKAADDFVTMREDAAKALVRLCLKHGVPVPCAKELVGATFAHSIIKTQNKAGGYVEKIKVSDLATTLTVSPV